MHISSFTKTLSALVIALGSAFYANAQALNGTYTIGGTTPSYATMAAAATALNTNGVSGPVTFNIRTGSYTGQATLNNITGASSINRITFQSESGNPANVTLTFNSTTTTNNFVIKLNNASYVTIKNISLTNGGSTYGRVVELVGSAGNDSLINCKLTSPVRTTASVNTAVLFADNLTGSNNVFRGNTFLNGSYSVHYSGTGTTNLANNGVFLENTLQNSFTYAAYLYYTNNIKFNNNIITTNSTDNAFYGVRSYYGDGAVEIIGNKISGFIGGYGMYLYYNDAAPTAKGLVANNVINFGSGTNTSNGIRSYYSSNQRFYNNTVNITSTSTTAGYAGYFFYNDVDYEGNEIKNNVFANTGGGYALFVQAPTFNNTFDYNNLYTTGAKLVDRGTPAADYTDLTAWRAAHGQDKNSISYSPAFTSAANLAPDATNPASWSLNGRGVQLVGNNKDINGNVRITDRTLGVPDIGAFEFTPSALPPDAIASPATPAAGLQVFTFGLDTVAVINWDATVSVPATISVKQYSGVQPAGVTTVNPNFSYFYTDINVPAGTYNYAGDIYYKESWLGTLISESSLRLAKKDGSNPWVAVSPAVSSADINRNLITTTGLTDFGWFTGIDVLNNASATTVTDPSGYFCGGVYAVKVRVKNNGGNTISNLKIGWKLDGITQTSVDYNTAMNPGDNAIVTIANVNFASGHTIKAWTYLPNNTADPIAFDDTVTVRLTPGLSGNYTVGGVSPNYATITDAVNDLNTAGVCGAVTFNIRNGNYSEKIIVGKIVGASNTNRITFQSETHNPANVNITGAGTVAADNYVFKLVNSSYVTLKYLTITNTGTTFARVFEMTDSASYDSLINCRLVGPVRTTASTNTAVFFADPLAGHDNAFIGNTFSNGSYSLFYSGTGTADLTDNGVFINNTLENAYTYAAYFYYTNNLKFNNNIIVTNSADNLFYGIRCYYSDGAQEIRNNTISGLQGGYGMYLYYNDATASGRGLVANNVISMGAGTNTANGIRSYYSNYQRFYNNTVNINSASLTAGYAGYFYYSSSSYKNNEIRNNIFANPGGGFALFVQDTDPAFNNSWDYNNLYTSGSKLVDDVAASAEHKNIDAWRKASGQDIHSISYDPGFVSATDLRPDAAKAASWSLNGRGIHIAGNNKDINGNARVELRADGVPDLGAYEFTPTSTPPDAEAVPANVVPGDKQYFTFGGDTVAVVTWHPALRITAPLAVKQYTGTIAPALQAASPSSYMYFYTTIADQAGATFNYDVNVNYKEPWLGTVTSEARLKLAHRYSTTPWVVYEDNSSANAITDIIKSAEVMTRFGSFTGVDSGVIFSAYIAPAGSTILCTGNNVTLNANTGTGYTYQWSVNGNPIAGATNASYTTNQSGDYTVRIISPRGAANSISVTLSSIAPPNPAITANGALTYCVTGSLSLNANALPGHTYQWQLNGADIVSANTASHLVAGPGLYTVRVGNAGCEITSPVTVVNPGPITVSLGADIRACEKQGNPIVLNASNNGAKYVWSTGDTTQTISVNTTGDYWVVVSAGAGCSAVDTVHLDVDPLPIVTGISYIKAGKTYTFSGAGVQHATNYTWIFDDNGNISTYNGATPPAKTYTASMKVRLIVANNCGADTADLTDWATSIPTTSTKDVEVVLYPNPASSNITMELDGEAKLQDVFVVNSVGAVVYKQTITNNDRKLTIDISNLQAGYYIMRVLTSEGAVSKTFNIVR